LKGRLSFKGFTLIEIMIAVLFITIGFFGYVALHARILHSGQRLEEREVIRSGTDFLEALEVGRITTGSTSSINGQAHVEDPTVTGLYRISSDVEGTQTSWMLNYPPEYHPGFEETMELSPTVLRTPYDYSWSTR
jgi:prepilin-type N-terminal cleavage/methylation domain-containing protein